MISHTILIHRFKREWVQLQQEEGAMTEFMQGMIRGLKLAKYMTQELWEQTKKQNVYYNAGGNRITYFQAIVTAHRQIKNGRKHNAIGTLKRVIERVEKESKLKVIATGDK